VLDLSSNEDDGIVIRLLKVIVKVIPSTSTVNTFRHILVYFAISINVIAALAFQLGNSKAGMILTWMFWVRFLLLFNFQSPIPPHLILNNRFINQLEGEGYR
jgi:hypothetical protein